MMTASTGETELAIRSRRAAFNRAIVDGDAAAIGPLLARDCVMLTGTDSAVIAGRNAQVKVWRSQFAAPGRHVYLRMPAEIVASPVEPIALEQGSWEGRDAESGTIAATGRYSAKWRMVGEEWVIEAEIFVTLA